MKFNTIGSKIKLLLNLWNLFLNNLMIQVTWINTLLLRFQSIKQNGIKLMPKINREENLKLQLVYMSVSNWDLSKYIKMSGRWLKVQKTQKMLWRRLKVQKSQRKETRNKSQSQKKKKSLKVKKKIHLIKNLKEISQQSVQGSMTA